MTSFRNSTQDKNLPWDTSASQKLSNLRPYDDPIIMNTSLQTAAPLIKVSNGIHGTTTELIQHLHTCLRVERFDRAVAIIQRLAEDCSPRSPEMLHAHTVYLEEQLRRVAASGKDRAQAQEGFKQMRRWFEEEVEGKGIRPDAKIIVIMARAAIRSLKGSLRDKALQKYASIARDVDEELYNDVLDSADLDDNEFTILGQAASQFYEEQTASHIIQPTLHSLLTPPQRAGSQQILPMEHVPEVLPTDQKGEGLSNIKRAMESFVNTPRPSPDVPLDVQRARAYDRQMAIEKTSADIATERWRKADEELRKIGIHTAMQSKPVGALMWQWYQALLPALEKELEESKQLLAKPGKTDHDRLHYGPYLEMLPLQRVAATTILHLMASVAKGKNSDLDKWDNDVKLNQLTTTLGKAIEQECAAEANERKFKKQSRAANNRRSRQAMQPQWKQKGKRMTKPPEQQNETSLASVSWPLSVKVKLGAMLVAKLIKSAQLPVTREHPRTKKRITQMQPAFLHRIKYRRGKRVGIVTPNPAIVSKLESEPVGSLIAKYMPMVVEPQPWVGWEEGGYLTHPNPVLRLASGDKSAKDYFLAAHNNGDLKQVYAGLTALGNVPWKVNHDVFKVQLEAWNSGEEVANLAPLHPHFDTPPEPPASSDPGPRRKWLQIIRDVENKRAGLHSKRCFQNFQLEIARAVVNEKLYFPHNLDFRGRAYPIPPYLNHMGADNVRGLLTFAEGKMLGPGGLRWLKIHLATVAGYDKASLEERVEFTMQHLDDIYDSVRNPLGGGRWWLKAEDAWQTLAACFELTRALDSRKPEEFLSNLPVQQDGTCNGLQHYAALGGDLIGARQVNLEPGDRPADVYTAVAEAVKAEVRKDALLNHPVAQKLDGRITRKCVKQPVMTNVYGVTFYGAKEQVHRQLEVLFPEVGRFDEVNLDHMSHYVATKIFKSLGSMFGGAQAIQLWLGTCAERISSCLTQEQVGQLIAAGTPAEEGKKVKMEKVKEGKEQKVAVAKKRTNKSAAEKSAAGNAKETNLLPSIGSEASERMARNLAKPLFKSTVVWTTPLRLPVVQPYRTSKSRVIATVLQNLHLQEPQVWDPVSKRKQLQAFPPNFIHSLDATHMLLSALKCSEQGMTFASIHDSFWTHACDVADMSSVLRDAFVKMHSENVIGRLREEFQARYEGGMYMATVLANSPVGVEIARWRKERGSVAGGGRSSELALETERVRLMRSVVEAEREKGEGMVTPGRIFLDGGGEAAFAAPSEMVGQGLGDLPKSNGVQGRVSMEQDQDQDQDDEVEATNSDADVLAQEDVMESEGVVSGSVLDTDVDELAASTTTTATTDEQHATSLRKTLAPRTPARKLYVWLPMAFPEVPAKGGFDVTRLKESKYFFH